MGNLDNTNSLNITDLNSLVSLNGDELLLIQGPGSQETNKITISQLLNELARLLGVGGTISIIEQDPTVPQYVKDLSESDLISWNKGLEDIRVMKGEIKDLQTPSIKISSLICTPNAVELGNVVNSVTLKWTTNNKPITSITVNDINIDPTLDTYTSNRLIANTTPFKLVITDDGGYTAEKTVSVEFLNGLFYGSKPLTEINSSFIKTLNKTLTNTRNMGFTTLSREDEYIYIAFPTRLGSATFKIEEEVADFILVGTFEFINDNSYVEEYLVYRSVNVHLGQTTVKII